MCRYIWHSAGSLGWPIPMLKYKNNTFFTEAISSNSTRKLLSFEIIRMPIAGLKKINLLCHLLYFSAHFRSLWNDVMEWWYKFVVYSRKGRGWNLPGITFDDFRLRIPRLSKFARRCNDTNECRHRKQLGDVTANMAASTGHVTPEERR